MPEKKIVRTTLSQLFALKNVSVTSVVSWHFVWSDFLKLKTPYNYQMRKKEL
jgi:hypothetical protein